MIQLAFPKESSEQYYLVWKNIAFGIYTPDGLYAPEVQNFDSTLVAFSQSRGMYHENNVEHDRIEGEFEYHPIVNNCQFSPTYDYPRKMSIPVRLYTGSTAWKTVNYGLAILHGATYGRVWSVTNYPLHYAFQRTGTYQWQFYELQALKDDPYSVNSYSITTINSISKVSGDLVSVNYTKQYYNLGTSGIGTDINWSQQQSYETITSFVPSSGLPLLSITASSYGYLYKVEPDLEYDFRGAKERIDSLIATLIPMDFPISEKHYGELAMEACEQARVNEVNMLAFTRDLFHIKDLIPKLKNLHRVKTWANNYLAVEYGVLPTIRDLEDIWAAVHRAKPYVDRNGFTDYTAGYTDDYETAEVSYHLVQRIRLAVANEDEAFIALLNKLDSIGAFPTLENIWDLIAYSFVVDWFVDVGSFLERVDTHLRLQRLNIKVVTMSRKASLWSQMSDFSQSPFVGWVNWSQYHRWVTDKCPTPPLSLQLQERDFDHWLESAALLIAR